LKTHFTAPPYMRPTLDVLASLARTMGLEGYVVGGTVRDVLLDRRPVDLDVALSRDALVFARHAADILGGHDVELDDDRSVARVVLKREERAEASTERRADREDIGVRAIAAFCEAATRGAPPVSDAISYIDIAQLQGDLSADLRRRDFTIDALAVPIDDAARA